MGMAFDGKPFNEDGYICKEFLTLRKKYQIDSIIETGTYHGITTKWLCANFEYVQTVECNRQYYDQAIINLEGIDNLDIYYGKSEEILIDMLNKAGNKPLIFLDAHWYESPLLKELEMIACWQKTKKQPFHKIYPIVVIHDFKVPDTDLGYDSYNGKDYCLEFIQKHLKWIYGSYTHYYNTKAEGARRGVIYIVKN